MKKLVLAIAGALLVWATSAQASVAYGSLNNFDTVNDTGHECHGFDIEIEDVHSRDITYTYDYNHYGAPRITEDLSNPLHSVVRIRYEAKKNPDGSWSAYTAVPAGPINPTDGHQFTNPNVNFGGEHFGVGFYGAPGAIRYFWLGDDGAGNLYRSGEVLISTPSFVYYPPVGNVAAQVNAVIQVPEPVEVPVKEFGDPMWVKVTRTQTHNNNRVKLEDLVSDDPEDDNDKNWKNGEPDEIEIEWQLVQTEFNAVDGGENGQLENEPQELPDGDEVITIRYDFYKYAGPLDFESGEAKASKVGVDDLHGEGVKKINGVDVDLSTVVVVGDYVGAQMAGFDPAGQIGLIEHLQDGELYVDYVERAVVIGGTAPIITTITGDLPAGMNLDTISGVLSGAPTESGTFTFSVHSTDAAGGDVTASYTLNIAGDDLDVVEPIATVLSPLDGQVVSGGVTIEADAFDNVGVTSVSLTVNDAIIAEVGFPFVTTWDTTTVPNGSYAVSAIAYDAAGNAGTAAPVTVTVANNFAPTITSVPTQATVELGAAFKYTATTTGYPAPTFSLVTKPVGMTVNRITGLVRWVPLATQLGTHSFTLRAKNSSGQQDQTWAITVQDTKAPTRPSVLVASDIASTSFTLSWTGSTDKAGVAGYRVYDYYIVNATTKYWRVIQDNVPATSTSVTGLKPNKSVRYAVSAIDVNGNESAKSVQLVVKTLP
jgi:hypothetical protein